MENTQNEHDFKAFELAITDCLEGLISYDLSGSGQYLDDDIGEQEFDDDVGQVRESMAKVLWDCYCDNLEDVIIEELGSDFRGTI